MGVPSVVHVTDTHFSPRTPEASANWLAVVDHVEATSPELVVHTGDLTVDGASVVQELDLARAELDRLAAPWRAVPGNHDVGDVAPSHYPIDADRLERYRARFGDGFWIHELGEWQLVGFDVQTLRSDLPEAADRLSWLDAATRGDRPTAVFLHRPLRPARPGDDDEPARYVTEPHRARLSTWFDRPSVRLVACGHVHQYVDDTLDGTRTVWAPSTWAAIPDDRQPVIGRKVVGFVEYDLGDDGSLTTRLVVPPAIAQHVVGETIPSPYAG